MKNELDKTVLIIGHRLKNIVVCDMVLSLKPGGRVENFDQPDKLIDIQSSLLMKYIKKSHNPKDLLELIKKQKVQAKNK